MLQLMVIFFGSLLHIRYSKFTKLEDDRMYGGICFVTMRLILSEIYRGGHRGNAPRTVRGCTDPGIYESTDICADHPSTGDQNRAAVHYE